MRHLLPIPLSLFFASCAGSHSPAPAPESNNLLAIAPQPSEPTPATPNSTRPAAVAPAPPGSRVGPAASLKVIPKVIAGCCAITKDRTLHCQCGDAEVPAPSGKFVTIDHAEQVYCGVREDQSAVCWYQSGQRVLPMPAGGFASVSVSQTGSVLNTARFCGIRPQGDVDCWQLAQDGAKLEVHPFAHESGKFVQTALGSYELHLLDETGMVKTVKTRKNVLANLAPSGGTFTEISGRHRLRSDGTLLTTELQVIGKPRSNLIAHTEGCDLLRDGSIECRRRVRQEMRTTVHPGPFVMFDAQCAVRPDGRLKPLQSDGCPRAAEAWVPDVLQARIAPPAESLALKNFNAFEKLRTPTGTPREYRVAFSSREERYLELGQRGALIRRQHEALLNGRTTPVVGGEADLTLVDLNGGEIALGDPIHIKHRNQYAAVGPAPEYRIQLVASPTPAARFTIHTFDPDATADDNYGPMERGLANVLIRSSTGDFLIPCAQDVCATPPPRSGVRPAGIRSDLPPFWVKDPRFSDLDDDGASWFLHAGWRVMALVDCEDGGVRKKAQRACEVVPY